MSFALNNVHEAAFLMDQNARFRFVNDEACRILGYSREEILTMGVPDIDPDFPVERWSSHWNELMTRRSLLFEGRHRAKDGRVFPVEVNANYFEYKGQGYNLALVRDITERRRAEVSLQRLNRELRAISDCNQTLMRAQDEKTLLNDICRIVCNGAGYRMAWVGYAENDVAKTIRAVAWDGAEDGYLEESRLTWDDTELGRGPSGTAIRSGRSTCIQDFARDPHAAPWRTEALQRGYRSSIALPLKDEGGRTFGILDIYSIEPDAYSGEEIRLLEELSGDLAFGITVLRARNERRLVEEERLAYLRYFENMDRINRAMQGTNDLEQMLKDVLDTMLSIFDCDRAWLIYPCDPEAPSWHVPVERTRPEYPGAFVQRIDMPMDPDAAELFRMMRASEGPLTCGPGSDYPVPADLARQFQIQSQILMAVYPKVGLPWVFGLHQCSHSRVWTPEERRLVQEIGRRLAETLTILLAHRDLQESEAKYRRIVDTASEGIWVLGPDTMTSFVNARMAAMLGCSAEVMYGRPLTDFMFEEDAPDHSRKMERRRQGLSENYERRFRCEDGRTLWALASVAPIFDDTHQFKGSLAMFTDITERKRAEQALVESHSLLNSVVEGTSDAVFVKDIQGRYLMINSAGARFLGRPVDEVIGKNDRELFTPETVQSITESDRHVMETGGSHVFEEMATAAGVTRTYFSTKSVYRDASGKEIGLIGIARDVTELKRLEEQLRQAQKMEAIGRLAGGVAHDFNNLLTVINGYSEMAFGQLPEGHPIREPLAEILKAGGRAATLTRQLLAFSRKQVLQPRILDINTQLAELQKMLLRLIGEDVELVMVPGAGLGLAKVDPGHFEQAVVNLVVNARDAMPHGGRLRIETRNAELDATYAEHHPEVRPGRYVLVTVRDSGHGMDHDTRGRIFEPFFTTKEPGKGTGLGMAMVYGFVKQSGGHIEVDSEVGRGTTFEVYLPCAEGATPSTEALRDSPRIPMGTKTVLLAEDEDAVRRLASIALQSGGYTVLEARDGQEAIRIAQQHEGPIHILVTDLVMPGISGRQVADQVMLARPGMRFLLMSGYTGEMMLSHGVQDSSVAYLQKPFSPSELARKVSEVLNG
jgi:PAS domain S-box-containing protein